MVEVDQKGVAVRNLDGSYVFYPGYDPAEDEKCLAIPLDTGENYLVGIAGNGALQADDPARVMPVQGGGMMAVADNSLPILLTSGISAKYVAVGYIENLGTFDFNWNGSGSLYLSGGKTLSDIFINDGVVLTTDRGTASGSTDPVYEGQLNVTAWADNGTAIFQAGQNTLTVGIKNNYTDFLACGVIYLIQV